MLYEQKIPQTLHSDHRKELSKPNHKAKFLSQVLLYNITNFRQMVLIKLMDLNSLLVLLKMKELLHQTLLKLHNLV